ncbi:hypothetical protein [Methylobacterium sp. Gmos1]
MRNFPLLPTYPQDIRPGLGIDILREGGTLTISLNGMGGGLGGDPAIGMAILDRIYEALPPVPADNSTIPITGAWYRDGDASGYRPVKLFRSSGSGSGGISDLQSIIDTIAALRDEVAALRAQLNGTF